MAAQENSSSAKRSNRAVSELNMREWYTGTQLAELLGVSVNWLCSCIKHTPVAAQMREYAIGKFGPISIYNKAAMDAWVASVGGPAEAKAMLRKGKTAFYGPRNKEYNDRKKGKGYYSPAAYIVKRKKVSYFQVVGEGNADTLAALMAGIASKPVRKYNHKEFGGC